jgi:hypothetical protein
MGPLVGMTSGKLILALGAAVLIGTSATAAQAETAKARPQVDITVRPGAPSIAPQGIAKTLQYDARKGRWGLTVNMDRPSSREMQLNDVQAGAYFRITPSLRIGGAVALGAEDNRTPAFKQTEPLPARPRVRLETAFKF